ncbi:MAG: bifunctional DNA primase/polymerase [Synergistota bacterium]|nr:bifunctional DNA primase/polymerase [Synergistota bacterium]
MKSHSKQISEALQYNRWGWVVIPLHYPLLNGKCSCSKPDCPSPGKHPLAKWKSVNGDLLPEYRVQTGEDIKRWWSEHPNANLGIITGQISGIVVVDIDGKEGERYIRDKELPSTPTVITGRGRHLYFKAPDFDTKNSVCILPQVDIRGDGGLVVAPPSIHVSGDVYKWVEGTKDLPLADLPPWLRQLLKPKEKQKDTISQSATEIITEGNRNDYLTSIAGSMNRRGMSLEAIVAGLQEENRSKCFPPLSESEVRDIAKSVSRYPSEAPYEIHKKEHETDVSSFLRPGGVSERVELVSVGNLFLKGFYSVLAGQPGGGKSLLMLKLCDDLARGGIILNGYARSDPMRTLFIEGDYPKNMMDWRIQRMKLSVPFPAVQFVYKDEFLSDGLALDLSSAKGYSNILELARMSKPDLLILDSLASLQFKDENDNSAMKTVCLSLSRLAKETGSAVVAVHHLKKVKRSERTLPISLDDLIGASMISRLASSAYGVQVKEDEDGQLHIVKNLKSWVNPPGTFTFRTKNTVSEEEELELLLDVTPFPEESNSTGKIRIINTIRAGHSQEPFKRSIIARETGVSDTYSKQVFQDFIGRGILRQIGHGKATMYELVQ